MSILGYLCDATEYRPLPGYRLQVKCSDRVAGIFDMSGYLDHGMFKALRDEVLFSQVRLVAGAPTWPGNIDVAPERVRFDMIPA